MSEKSCLDCCNYIFDGGHGGCKLHNYYIPTTVHQKKYAKDCADYTSKQSCVNCVHYRDKRCFLHKFDVKDPEYSVILCNEFTPITSKCKIKQQDPVNPSHYTQGKIECIDAIEAALTPEEFRGFLKGNVFKYMWRHKNKNGLEDVKKGDWYYERLLEHLENKSDE